MFEKKISANEKVKLVDHASKEYDEIIDVRYEILRKPLRLNFTPEQLAAEKEYFHLGYYLNEKLIACLMLVPEENGRIKMKQVAVVEQYQGHGHGARLVLAAEQFAKENGFDLMYCHARDTAIPFYMKLQYLPVGEMFEEVSIPHLHMEKNI